jgi:hypothetical protein
MHDKASTKSPADFINPDEWRQYVERTVPPEEVRYTLAFGRTILFARFYEVRSLGFPYRFLSDLAKLVSLREPGRTRALEALNDRIFAETTRLLCTTAQIHSQGSAECGDVDSRRLIDDLITFLANESGYLRTWMDYSERGLEHANTESWEESVGVSVGATEEQEIEFAALMAQMCRLLLHFRDQNLALPVHTFSRTWFLHCLRGAERNAHARAVVQELTEALHPCACA